MTLIREIEIASPLESNGAIPVNIQDQHSRAFDFFFSQDVGSPTTLTTDTAEGDYAISCTTGHGLIALDHLTMFDTVTQRGYTGEVVSVAGDNTVNLDRAINAVFPSATTVVQEETPELNVNGAITRQTFTVDAPLLGELDITRLLFQMTTTGAPTYNLFGDLTALTRGVQLRGLDGQISNHWNVKSNAELANLMFDFNIYLSTHPQGVNGLAGRLTYAGQSKHGVTLRISPGESLEIIIQDDLSSLLSFRIIACGHLVTD